MGAGPHREQPSAMPGTPAGDGYDGWPAVHQQAHPVDALVGRPADLDVLDDSRSGE
jgi:hypothetical protein